MKQEFEKGLKKNRNILRGIGILEIIGGITGILLIIWLSLQGTETNSLAFLILLAAVGFYIYSIFAGIKLYKKLENGLLHSQILQYIQILAFSIGGFTYLMTSGGYLLVGYDFTAGSINFSFALIASKFQLNIYGTGTNDFLSINLLALFILFLLDRATKRIGHQNLLKESYEQNMKDWMDSNK